MQPLFRTKFKRFHKRKAIIISIIGLMIVFLVMINWWFIIYLKQIESIDEISLQVKQSATVDLPKTVKAKLRNNEYKTVDVSWEEKELDTDKIGTIEVEGRVENFEEKVTLKLKVYKCVKFVVPPRSMTLIQRDDISNNDLDLPEYLFVEYSSGRAGKEKVDWDLSGIDTRNTGKYIVNGKFASDILCEEEIVFLLDIIDRQEAVSRIIVDNELLEEYEVRKSIYKVQTLPSKVLERLLEGKVTIEYIHEDITDLPEFERLKEYESDNLKVFGAFKYPKIVVDSQALDYIQFAKIDTFSTIVLHEIGHSYDYLFDKNDESNKFDLSNKKEFEDIWKEEGARLFNTRVTGMTKEQNQYYINYQYEFFAESFAFYFDSEESKRTLLEYAPRTYNFIDKHVN